jgi:hypothetical protein
MVTMSQGGLLLAGFTLGLLTTLRAGQPANEWPRQHSMAPRSASKATGAPPRRARAGRSWSITRPTAGDMRSPYLVRDRRSCGTMQPVEGLARG